MFHTIRFHEDYEFADINLGPLSIITCCDNP